MIISILGFVVWLPFAICASVGGMMELTVVGDLGLVGNFCGAVATPSAKKLLVLQSKESTCSVNFILNNMLGYQIYETPFRRSEENALIEVLIEDPEKKREFPLTSLEYVERSDILVATLASGETLNLLKRKCAFPFLEGPYVSNEGLASAQVNPDEKTVLLRTPSLSLDSTFAYVDPTTGEFVFSPEVPLGLTYVAEEDSMVLKEGRRLFLLFPEYDGLM